MRIKSTLLIAVLLISLSPQSVNGSSKEPTTKKYSVTMKKAHLPTAPKNGTDDYRCFLLDPKVTEDSIIRTIQFIPQRKNFVHHAIIFRVTDADLPQAIASDKNGTGWPCFGGSGLGSMLSSFVTTPWISSWAPGRGKDISPPGYGTPFKKGEQFVLQVHYNLLAANGGKIQTDQSKIVMKQSLQKAQRSNSFMLNSFLHQLSSRAPQASPDLCATVSNRLSIWLREQAKQVHLNRRASTFFVAKIHLILSHP